MRLCYPQPDTYELHGRRGATNPQNPAGPRAAGLFKDWSGLLFQRSRKVFRPRLCVYYAVSSAAGSIADRAGQLEKAILDQVPKEDLDRGAAIHIVAHVWVD